MSTPDTKAIVMAILFAGDQIASDLGRAIGQVSGKALLLPGPTQLETIQKRAEGILKSAGVTVS